MEYHVDGDKGSLIGYLTTDAMKEAKEKISSVEFYTSATGEPTLDLIDDIIEKTIQTMTQ